MQKKKILIFSIAYYPFVGGAEVAVKEITDRIGDFEFHMITLSLKTGLPSVEKIGNILVHRIGGPKILFPFLAFLRARRLHKIHSYNLIWSIMANYAGFASLFFKINYPKVPFVLTLQEGDPISYIKRKVFIIYPLFKMIFTKADRVTAISSYLANWAKEMGANKIKIVPNGVDVQKFKCQNSNVKSGERKDRIVITTSRLVEKNGIKDLIDAMKYLPDSYNLWIIGDGPLYENFKVQILSLNLENRVTMFGHMEHDKMIDYLHQADVFARPSLSEGLGNSFLEAMAAGLPVIGTAVGGIPDFLYDGETGLICRVNDPENIAKKVRIIMEDDILRKQVISGAQKKIREKFDWRTISLSVREGFESF